MTLQYMAYLYNKDKLVINNQHIITFKINRKSFKSYGITLKKQYYEKIFKFLSFLYTLYPLYDDIYSIMMEYEPQSLYKTDIDGNRSGILYRLTLYSLTDMEKLGAITLCVPARKYGEPFGALLGDSYTKGDDVNLSYIRWANIQTQCVCSIDCIYPLMVIFQLYTQALYKNGNKTMFSRIVHMNWKQDTLKIAYITYINNDIIENMMTPEGFVTINEK